MEVDDVDIYEDLENFDEDNDKNYQEDNQKLIKKCEELEESVSKLTEENKLLTIKVREYEKNYSSFFKTAHSEIERKDRMIAELRRQVDNAAFRRGNYKIPKKNEIVQGENSSKSSAGDPRHAGHKQNNIQPKIIKSDPEESKATQVTTTTTENKINLKKELINEEKEEEINEEEEEDEEEIYEPEKVSTTVYSARLQKQLQQQMLEEEAANKIRREKEKEKKKEADLKLEGSELKKESNNFNKNNQTVPIDSKTKINNQENKYHLIPMDFEPEKKVKTGRNESSKRPREYSPEEVDKRRKVTDEGSSQRLNGHYSSDKSSSRQKEKKMPRHDYEYFCSVESNNVEPRSKRQTSSGTRGERGQRYDRENYRSNSRDDDIRSNSRENNRNNSRENCRNNNMRDNDRNTRDNRRGVKTNRGKPRKSFPDRQCGKILRNASRDGKRDDGWNEDRRRNVKEEPRRDNRPPERGRDQYDRNNERGNSREKGRDEGRDQRDKNYQRSSRDINKEKFKERSHDRETEKYYKKDEDSKLITSRNISEDKLKEKETEKYFDRDKEKSSESKKNNKPTNQQNLGKNFDLRDRLRKHHVETKSTTSQSPIKEEPEPPSSPPPPAVSAAVVSKEKNTSDNLETKLGKKNLKNSEDEDKKLKNKIEEIVNVKTDYAGSVSKVLSILEDGEIPETPMNSPCKENNEFSKSASLNDSLKEEMVENIEKFILKSFGEDKKFEKLSDNVAKDEPNENKNNLSNGEIEEKLEVDKNMSAGILKKLLTASTESLVDEQDNDVAEPQSTSENLPAPVKLESQNKSPDDKIEIKKNRPATPEESRVEKNNPNDVKNEQDTCDDLEKKKEEETISTSESTDEEKINKSTWSPESSMEVLKLEISAISSASEKSNDQEIDSTEDKKIIIPTVVAQVTTGNDEPLKTLSSVSPKKNQTKEDTNHQTSNKDITKVSEKNSTDVVTQKKDAKEKENKTKDGKNPIVVRRRRRGPIKLSNCSITWKQAHSDSSQENC